MLGVRPRQTITLSPDDAASTADWIVEWAAVRHERSAAPVPPDGETNSASPWWPEP